MESNDKEENDIRVEKKNDLRFEAVEGVFVTDFLYLLMLFVLSLKSVVIL